LILGLERTANVIKHRGKPAQISGGVVNFRVLKTAQSSFLGFVKDKYTTLEGRCVNIVMYMAAATFQMRPAGFCPLLLRLSGSLQMVSTWMEHNLRNFMTLLFWGL
jgi:hypothetical protein